MRGVALFDLLRRPEVDYAALDRLVDDGGAPELAAEFRASNPMPSLEAMDDRLPAAVRLQVEVRARYSGYIERQQDDIDRQRKHETLALPQDLDYGGIAGLSTEARQRLAAAKPDTLGQASRLPGITPAAVSVLLVHLKRRAG